MRTLVNAFVTVAIVIAIVVAVRSYYASYVDTDTFNKAHRLLNQRVDTVIFKIDTVSTKVDSLRSQIMALERQLVATRRDLDSLKKGQVLIYSVLKDLEDRPSQAQASFRRKLSLLYKHLINRANEW